MTPRKAAMIQYHAAVEHQRQAVATITSDTTTTAMRRAAARYLYDARLALRKANDALRQMDEGSKQ